MPKGNQGSPTEKIRDKALDIDNQTEALIKSSKEQGSDIRECAEGLKSYPVTSRTWPTARGEL
eukprot:5899280-Prorocentrum_lima.AAC.1